MIDVLHGNNDAAGSYQLNGQLVIPECKPTYGGQYICTIHLVNGQSRIAYSTLVISPDQVDQQPESMLNKSAYLLTLCISNELLSLLEPYLQQTVHNNISVISLLYFFNSSRCII